MVEFNLERWLRTGEELCLGNGKKVLACKYFPKAASSDRLVIIKQYGDTARRDEDGNAISNDSAISLFFVNDEEPKPQPKRGDTVWVKDYHPLAWTPRILIETFTGSDVACRCVSEGQEKAFKEGKYYSLDAWHYMRTTDPALDVNLEITVKLNGKEILLSELSDETLLAIKNNLKNHEQIN